MKTNFHTHTTFCDGKNTAEEMVLAAIEKNFDVLGFSGHAMYPFSSDWHIGARDIGAYCEEINRLKKAYEGKIQLKLGFEADYIRAVTEPTFSAYDAFSPEYIIGSVHYIQTKEAIFAIDSSLRELKEGIRTHFSGDVKKAVQAYFSTEREMLRKGGFSIIGHADLITKFQEREKLFDEGESWYVNELKATADEIKRAGVIAEINTGAIARGHRTLPYPGETFLSLLRERGVPVIISSDSHSVQSLDTAFGVARAVAQKAGYREILETIF
ncbi:MAG: histidinol-phosphatase [Treponema sp.]|nr:histidinol-phosphatase [Treponema sp.]